MRKRIGMTQEQLAEKINVGQKQVSRIESGRTRAGLATYLRIANVFNVSVDYFLADALLIEPELLPGTIFTGEYEQQFLQEIIHAVLHYLNEKET